MARAYRTRRWLRGRWRAETFNWNNNRVEVAEGFTEASALKRLAKQLGWRP